MNIKKIKPSEPELYIWDRDFPTGRLKLPLPGGKFTMINYYNDPDIAIPVNHQPHAYYLHHTLPAYLISYNKSLYVGTYKEILKLSKEYGGI